MEILITNDDGFKSKGIHTLARIMAGFGNVTVIAPKHHQSAMSMAVSLGLKKLAWKALPEEGPGEWSYLDATPASCVKFALNYKFCERHPDVVVTGINHGTNAATAANYSATLGAADEGALNGCRAIGVSLCDFRPDADFSAVEATTSTSLPCRFPRSAESVSPTRGKATGSRSSWNGTMPISRN